jgi:hypothetical protein
VLVALMLLVCADPRAYDGPRDVASTQAEVDPFEGATEVDADDVDVDELARRLPALRAAPAPREPPVDRRAGRGLLIAGGVLASAGFVTSAVSVGVSFLPCNGFCEPYGAIVSGFAAPAPWLVGIGLLGGGMHRRGFYRAAHLGAKPARHGVFAAGLTMAIVGSGVIVASWWAPFFNTLAQLGGGPLAVAGAMMAGSARGRKLGARARVTAMPFVGRTSVALSLTTRW